MLPLKPHTATVYPKTEAKTGNERTGYTEGTGVSVRGRVIEKTPQDALEMFGFESLTPAVFLFETADLANVKLGYRVVNDGLTYYVLTEPQVLNGMTMCSHCRTLLERQAT